jgi:acylphosphatase
MSTQGALRAEVHGRVTGTGLSEAVVERARALGLLGWVHEDGDVLRVHAEGPRDAVDSMRAFVGEGESVERVVEQPAKVEGHEQFAIRGVPAGTFVVHENEGGFVLQLDVGGEPRTWLLRKEPAMDPAVKRMAIEAAGDAAGIVWDTGPYEQGGRVRWPEALERGHAVFVLHGDRLRGGFALQRTRGAQWLFVKRRDEHAR